MDNPSARQPRSPGAPSIRRAPSGRRQLRDACTTTLPSGADLNAVTATSHEGLRRALLAVQREGWDSDAGRAIVAELEFRSRSWACLSDRRCGRRPGTTDPADVVAVAWLTLEKSAAKAADAQQPWAYLWTVVGNELARAAIADARLSEPSRIRSHTPGPTAVVRVGVESDVFEYGATGQPGPVQQPDDMASPQVRELARRLAGDEAEECFWLDAIGRALDVMADARRSDEEYRLRRDPYMLDRLGFSLDELSALAALLIGPRKGDRAAQSLLLALHRDIDTPTEDVVGAEARVRVLRSHSPACAPSAA